MRPALLFLALACAVAVARAQPASSFATPARDAAAVFVAEGDFLVSRLASECLALVGRAESPQAFVAGWKKRNARYVEASAKYLEMRVQEAAAQGPEQRQAMLDAIRTAVQGNGEATIRALLQGRKEDGCMYGVTLVDTGSLDIIPSVPQYKELEALARWAAQ